MEQVDIKTECESLYEKIKACEDRLKELRSICKHERTFEGLYSWRVGAIHKSIICSDCGTCIKTL